MLCSDLGELCFQADNDELKDLFDYFGPVTEVFLVHDKGCVFEVSADHKLVAAEKSEQTDISQLLVLFLFQVRLHNICREVHRGHDFGRNGERLWA